MRMAYLILAHDNVDQLSRLLECLLSEPSEDFVLIHADKRSALRKEWSARSATLDPQKQWQNRIVWIENPVAVHWGHWSQVAAIHLLIKQAHSIGCDYAHLLSGVDWPIQKRDVLVTQLNAGLCHIQTRLGHMAERMMTYRFDSRWLRLSPEKDNWLYAITWEMRRLTRWLDTIHNKLKWYRSTPYGPWVYGSTWWSLPADALALLAKELPKLLRSGRLEGTICADEHVIPTIIAHAFPDRLADYKRYIHFPEGASSPITLTAADWPTIEASGAWFMRKVDAAHDPFFLSLPQKTLDLP